LQQLRSAAILLPKAARNRDIRLGTALARSRIMGVRRLEDLDCYQPALEFDRAVSDLLDRFPKAGRNFNFRDQLQDASGYYLLESAAEALQLGVRCGDTLSGFMGSLRRFDDEDDSAPHRRRPKRRRR
jgi:hypothetical protein